MRWLNKDMGGSDRVSSKSSIFKHYRYDDCADEYTSEKKELEDPSVFARFVRKILLFYMILLALVVGLGYLSYVAL